MPYFFHRTRLFCVAVAILALFPLVTNGQGGASPVRTDCLGTSDSLFWAQDTHWVSAPKAPSSNKIDVFYIVSSQVVQASDSTYRATLTPTDRRCFIKEITFVGTQMFDTAFNLYSPYYHQYTFDLLRLPESRYRQVCDSVFDEVAQAFDYYMEHLNGGRRFILAGFSQGAQMAKRLLKRLSDEQFSRLVATYLLGYGVNDDDLRHPHLRAAQDAEGTGVVVSFNSVFTPEAAWPIAMDGAATCINPVNWHTDAEPVTFEFRGQTLSVAVDTLYHLLRISADPTPFHQWMECHPFMGQIGVGQDCLHHWDLMFYAPFIKENALRRAVNGER